MLENIDELFDREELSAAPDAGWPDCFNSGVFVFRPSQETYRLLLQFAIDYGSFDGAYATMAATPLQRLVQSSPTMTSSGESGKTTARGP